MKGKYKRKKIWCSSCDRNLVVPGKKCGVCGKREIGSKIKKPKKHEMMNIHDDEYYNGFD